MRRTIRTKRSNHRNKYSFSKHLDRPGDFVETFPITPREAYNLRVSAHMWAWDHSCRVTVSSYPVEDGLRVVRVTLLSRDRERDYR